MNSAEYLQVSADRASELLPLWTTVFNTDARFFTSLTDIDPGLSYGAWVDGKWVAAVQVLFRWIRGRDGVPVKVGGLANVSTLSDYRNQGHSGKLLKLAIKGMEDSGVVWSYLGTGVNDHYARYGWRTVSTVGWVGERLTNSDPLSALELTDALLIQMAGVYQEFTKTRPIAHVRSEAEWLNPLKYRLDPSRATLYGTYDGAKLVAYVITSRGSERGEVQDAACLPGAEPAFETLLDGAIAAFPFALKKVMFGLPEDSKLFEVFSGLVSNLRPAEWKSMMARPIAERITWPNLAALLMDTSGRHCALDNF